MDDALRPARHLSENVPKHPEKSGTSESKPAMNKPPLAEDGNAGKNAETQKKNLFTFSCKKVLSLFHIVYALFFRFLITITHTVIANSTSNPESSWDTAIWLPHKNN